MAEEGGDNLIAVARHIAKTIGRSDTMTDDIIQIFSTFDARFSRENLSESTAASHGNIRFLDRQITRYVGLTRSIWSNPDDPVAFLHAVDSLISFRRELDDPLTPHANRLIDLADDLISKSMLRLEDEFRSLMDHGLRHSSPMEPFSQASPMFHPQEEETDEDCIPVAQPVTDYNIVIDALPWGTISDLHEISKRMAVAGSGKVCAHTYSISRRHFLEESISRLGLHNWNPEELQARPWIELDKDIQRWIHAVKVSVLVLFPSERHLCDRVFSEMPSVADLSFSEVCRGPAVQLLGFANEVAVGSKMPERLFRILDMYKILSDLLPEIESLFSDRYCFFLRSESGIVSRKLGATIRAIFTELENLIRRDPNRSPFLGGGVHPITRYVMNYLRAASACWGSLEEVIRENGETRETLLCPSSSSSLAAEIAWIIEILQGSLELKSKVYLDPDLSCVFLMNNGQYVLRTVKDAETEQSEQSELMQLLGEEWIRRQTKKVGHYQNSYQRSTWGKLIKMVQKDDSNESTKSLMLKFRRFNLCFEDICRTRSRWMVPDEQLRSELMIWAVGYVLPAYRNFLGRCRIVMGSENLLDKKYVKYSAEDVEDRIIELFEGS